MKNILKVLSSIIIFFALSQYQAIAQEKLILNLDKSIQIALEKNRDLKLAKLDRDKSYEQIDEAWGSAVLPEINGFVNYRRAIKRGQILIETPVFTGSFPQGSENTLSFGADLKQPLFTAAVFLAVRVAKTFADISDRAVYSTQAELILNVKKAYYSLLVSREVLDLTKLTLKLAENNLKDVESRYNAGIVPEYDYIRSKVQVKNILPELDRAENSVKMSVNMLKLILGLDLDADIEVTDTLDYKEIQSTDLSSSLEMMDERNFTLQQLKLQMQLQDDAVSYQFSQHFPELYLNGNYTSTAQENDPRSFNRWRYINSVYVGLNLKIPIFNGFQTSSKVQQAKIDLYKSQEQYEKTSNALNNRLTEIFLSINEVKSRLEAYSSTISEAQLGYDIAEKRYQSGIGTQLEVIDALVTLTRSKVDYLSAIYDYYILNAEHDQLLGVGVVQ